MQRNKVIKSLIMALAISFCFCSLANAEPNIHIGALEIHPFASVEQKYDDNIFLEPDGQEDDDWITTATLGLRMYMPLVPVREKDFIFEGGYHADIIRFWDYTHQNRVDHTAHGLADFKFTNDFTLLIKERFRKTADPATSELTALQKRWRNTAGAVAGYKREKIAVDLGYENIRDKYLDLVNLDKWQNIITPTFYYQLFPKTSVFGEYNYGIIDYDEHTTNSNSHYHQFRIGLKGEYFPKITGIVKAGYEHRIYDESIKSDFSGFTMYGNVIYRFKERSTLDIYGERRPVESTYSTNSYFAANTIGFKFDHQLLERLFLIGGAYYKHNKYPDETTEGSKTAKRRDSILDGKLGLRYEIRDWIHVEGSYEYKQRDSKFSNFEYKDNKVLGKVSVVF